MTAGLDDGATLRRQAVQIRELKRVRRSGCGIVALQKRCFCDWGARTALALSTAEGIADEGPTSRNPRRRQVLAALEATYRPPAGVQPRIWPDAFRVIEGVGDPPGDAVALGVGNSRTPNRDSERSGFRPAVRQSQIFFPPSSETSGCRRQHQHPTAGPDVGC